MGVGLCTSLQVWGPHGMLHSQCIFSGMVVQPRLGARYSPLRQVVMQDKRNMGVLREKRKDAVSPHTVMGMSCIVLAVSIMTVTLVIVRRKYYRARHARDTVMRNM